MISQCKKRMFFQDKEYENINSHHITQANAEYRASIVSNISYDVTLAFPKGDHYFGRSIAKFELKDLPS